MFKILGTEQIKKINHYGPRFTIHYLNFISSCEFVSPGMCRNVGGSRRFERTQYDHLQEFMGPRTSDIASQPAAHELSTEPLSKPRISSNLTFISS
jgi:hypothetical protein